jgi:hypothetical protein
VLEVEEGDYLEGDMVEELLVFIKVSGVEEGDFLEVGAEEELLVRVGLEEGYEEEEEEEEL